MNTRGILLATIVFLSATCFDAFVQPVAADSAPDDRSFGAEDWPM